MYVYILSLKSEGELQHLLRRVILCHIGVCPFTYPSSLLCSENPSNMSPSMQEDQMPELDPSQTTRSTQAVAKLGSLFNAGILAETIIKSTITGRSQSFQQRKTFSNSLIGSVTNYNYSELTFCCYLNPSIVTKLDYGNEQETRTATLNWLSSLDYERKQQQFVERRAPNTGQWLLNLKEFATWRSKETHKLWCFGMRK